MEIEQLEIYDFFDSCSPVNTLSGIEKRLLVNSLEIKYLRAGETLLTPGEINNRIYVIRSGALSLTSPNNELIARLEANDWVGHISSLHQSEVKREVTVKSDCLLYAIPIQTFKSIHDKHEHFQIFFSMDKPSRLRQATKDIRQPERNALVSIKVGDIILRSPLILDATTSIKQAANLMKANNVTSILVEENQQAAGLVSDRAFCTEVVANNIDFSAPIKTIMSDGLITISKDALGSEALLLMAKHNIKNIPVIDKFKDDKVLGMVTALDLIRQESQNPVFLVNEVHRASSVAELKKLSESVPKMLVNLVENSLSAHDTSHSISSVGKAICKRLIQLAEEKYGSPPVPYTFVLAGSQARNEQVARSDQDNMMVISDDFIEEEHDEYFANVATFVCDGLNTCGYMYCPGDVMATNKQWRQPLSVWKNYFKKWINEPEPKALMYASTFFDMRSLYGEISIFRELKNYLIGKAPNNAIFLNLLAKNALHYRPPVSLFKNFILEKSGFEEKALNMKRRGVVPIIDLARVYAMKAGIREVNTQQRLAKSADAGVISKTSAHDLHDALEYISTIRLQQQAQQIQSGATANNYVPPESLSSLEKRHLKDAFEVVSSMQSSLERNS